MEKSKSLASEFQVSGTYAKQGLPESILGLISEHCLSDILREAVLLLRYPEHGGTIRPVGWHPNPRATASDATIRSRAD